MAQPEPYALAYDFVGWQISNASRPLPADKLETELNAVKATLDEVLANLALIQRDDGEVANGELNMMFRPTAAAGGSANRLDVWNMYHRVAVTSLCRDSTNTWTYSTATTRSANNSASNRVTAVFGLSEDAVRSRYSAPVTSTTSNSMARVGVGRDSTTGFDGVPGQIATQSGSSGFQVIGHDSGQPAGIGSHYFQALERAELGTVTWYGDDNAPTITQMALTVEAVM